MFTWDQRILFYLTLQRVQLGEPQLGIQGRDTKCDLDIRTRGEIEAHQAHIQIHEIS